MFIHSVPSLLSQMPYSLASTHTGTHALVCTYAHEHRLGHIQKPPLVHVGEHTQPIHTCAHLVLCDMRAWHIKCAYTAALTWPGDSCMLTHTFTCAHSPCPHIGTTHIHTHTCTPRLLGCSPATPLEPRHSSPTVEPQSRQPTKEILA